MVPRESTSSNRALSSALPVIKISIWHWWSLWRHRDYIWFRWWWWWWEQWKMMQMMTMMMKTWYCIACTTHHLSGVHISPSKKLTFVTCCKNRSQWKKSIEEAYEAASSLYHTQHAPQRDSFLHLLPDNGDEDGNDGNICDHGFKYSPISTKMWISTVDGFIFYLL